MAIEITVPDIGDFKDIPIIEIHVKPGDAIKADDPLITLESDKATMDVPARPGRHGREPAGQARRQGEPGQPDRRARGRQRRGRRADAPRRPRWWRSRSRRGEARGAPTAPPAAQHRHRHPPRQRPAVLAGVHASPSVRRLARELEVDLAKLKGTGEKGRITKEDVKAFLQGPAPGAGGRQQAPVGRHGHPRDPGPGLLQVRPDREEAARPDQAALRPAPAPLLAQHPARHPRRRERHHRDRRLPEGARRGRQGEGLPGDAAGLPDEGRGLGTPGLPRVQQLARRRRRTA